MQLTDSERQAVTARWRELAIRTDAADRAIAEHVLRTDASVAHNYDGICQCPAGVDGSVVCRCDARFDTLAGDDFDELLRKTAGLSDTERRALAVLVRNPPSNGAAEWGALVDLMDDAEEREAFATALETSQSTSELQTMLRNIHDRNQARRDFAATRKKEEIMKSKRSDATEERRQQLIAEQRNAWQRPVTASGGISKEHTGARFDSATSSSRLPGITRETEQDETRRRIEDETRQRRADSRSAHFEALRAERSDAAADEPNNEEDEDDTKWKAFVDSLTGQQRKTLEAALGVDSDAALVQALKSSRGKRSDAADDARAAFMKRQRTAHLRPLPGMSKNGAGFGGGGDAA